MAKALRSAVPMVSGELAVAAPNNYHSNSVTHQHTTTRYLNYTGIYISVADNKGLVVEYSPRTFEDNRDFIIREETYYPPYEANQIRNDLLRREGTLSPALQTFADEFHKQFTTKTHGVKITFDYVVTLDELRSNNGSILHIESNKIISMSQDVIPHHPFSNEAISLPPLDEGEPAMLEIFMVDNLGDIPTYRSTLIGEALVIPNVVREGRECGLYIAFQGDLSDFHEGDKQYEFYPKKHLDQVPFIYTDPIHALVLREVMVVSGKEIKGGKAFDAHISDMRAYQENARRERDNEHRRMEQEAARVESQNKRMEILSDRKHNAFERDLEMQHLDRRDQYEGRSISRKDRSEIIKNVPTVTSAVGSLVTIASKLLS